MFDFIGKNVFVIGVIGGIGKFIVKVLYVQGVIVVLFGMCENVFVELVVELGECLYVLFCNLFDVEVVDVLLKQVVEVMGLLDILVVNVGIIKDQLLMCMKDEDWDQVFCINLDSYFCLFCVVLCGMMKVCYGCIIGIMFVVGVMGNLGQFNYCVFKVGMIGFFKLFVQEVVVCGVIVNCVVLGFIVLLMIDVFNDEQCVVIFSKILVNDLGSGDDIVFVVVYFVSVEVGYVIGQILYVNGGMVMI